MKMMQGNPSGSDTAKAIYEQISIFDFMDPAAGSETDLEDLPEPEMISMISTQTGLKFEYIDHLNTYQATYNKQRIWVHYSVFNDSVPGSGGRRFISVSYLTNVGGASGPCESVKKAVERVKQYEQRILQQLQISNKL